MGCASGGFRGWTVAGQEAVLQGVGGLAALGLPASAPPLLGGGLPGGKTAQRGCDELTTLRQWASLRVKAASAGGGWCCGLVLGCRRPGSAGAGVSARGLGSRGEEAGAGVAVYRRGKRESAQEEGLLGGRGSGAAGSGTFGRVTADAPLLPAAGWCGCERAEGVKRCCRGAGKRGGVMNRNDTVAGEYRAVVVYRRGKENAASCRRRRYG